MHHKRHRPKNQRAGCLLCKSNKVNGFAKHSEVRHSGFGKIRDEHHASIDLKADI